MFRLLTALVNLYLITIPTTPGRLLLLTQPFKLRGEPGLVVVVGLPGVERDTNFLTEADE